MNHVSTVLILLSILIFINGCGNGNRQVEPKVSILTLIDTAKIQLVELPSPNSGTFSFEEAEKRKEEILGMQLSVKHFDWKNPTTGGAIHINQKDEIEVYQTFGGFFDRPKGYFQKVKSEQLMDYVNGVGYGNFSSVLITSEYDLSKSESIKLVLKEIFKPGFQIYYLKKK